jgi:hypothetical protein
MKKLFILLMLCATLGAFAQVNPGLKITLNGKNTTNISASFGAVMDFDVPVCAEIVVMDSKGGATPTAITKLEGCDDVLNAAAMKGKIALIRRGTCEFGAKALNAEKAGAIAVIIYNRVDATATPPNGPVGMAAGAVGADVTIPTAMISLEDAEAAIASIKAGTKITACFTRPSKLIDDVFGNPWGNMTPLSHVDTIAPAMSFINRKDSISGVISTAEITDPKGVKTILKRTHNLGVLDAGFVSIIPIDNYLPKEKGTYNVKFYSTFLPTDTVKSQFVISDYTFANDIGTLTGAGFARVPGTFGGVDLKVSNALSYFATGPKTAKATYISFGLRNAAKMAGRTIDISLLETDADRIDALTNTTVNVGDLGDLVGDVLTYTITGKEDPSKLIYVKLKDGAKPGIDLKGNTPYVLALQYDGSPSKDSICPEWSTAKTFAARWPGTPFSKVFGDAYMTGATLFRPGADIAARVHIDQFTIGTKNLVTLAQDEVSFFPNPTADVVNVKLALKETAKSVQLGIMDITGRILNTYTLDVQNGIIPVNISNYPSGTYFFTVKTDKAFITEKIIKD